MKIGVTELLLIFVVALIAIGPDKLPGYAKKLGEALAQFRKATEDAAKDIKESIVDPLEEAQKPLKDAVKPVEEMDRAVRSAVKDVQDSFAGIGKQKPENPSGEPAPAGEKSEAPGETADTLPETDRNEEE